MQSKKIFILKNTFIFRISAQRYHEQHIFRSHIIVSQQMFADKNIRWTVNIPRMGSFLRAHQIWVDVLGEMWCSLCKFHSNIKPILLLTSAFTHLQIRICQLLTDFTNGEIQRVLASASTLWDAEMLWAHILYK